MLKLHSTCAPSISQPRHNALDRHLRAKLGGAEVLRREALAAARSKWSLSSGTHLVTRSMTASYTAGCSSRQAPYALSERAIAPMLLLPRVFKRVSLQSKQLVFGYDSAFPPGTRVLKLHSTCTPSISQPRHNALDGHLRAKLGGAEVLHHETLADACCSSRGWAVPVSGSTAAHIRGMLCSGQCKLWAFVWV